MRPVTLKIGGTTRHHHHHRQTLTHVTIDAVLFSTVLPPTLRSTIVDKGQHGLVHRRTNRHGNYFGCTTTITTAAPRRVLLCHPEATVLSRGGGHVSNETNGHKRQRGKGGEFIFRSGTCGVLFVLFVLFVLLVLLRRLVC